MNPVGRARVETSINDLSVIVRTGLQGITAVMGVTERGPVGKSILLGSWNEYVRIFGRLSLDSDFPLLCKRAFERGGRLRIARAVHYTDPTNNTTLDGAEASNTFMTDASFILSLDGTTGDWNAINVTLNPAIPPASEVVNLLANVTGFTTHATLDLIGADVLVDIAQHPLVSGVVLVQDSAAGTQPYQIEVTLQGGYRYLGSGTQGAGADLTVASSADDLGTPLHTVTASDVGAWGNDLTVTVVDAFSGDADLCDVTIFLSTNPDLEQTILNVPRTLTVASINQFNASAELVNLSQADVGQVMQNSSAALVGGFHDNSLVVTGDYIGDSAAQTGIHVFDNGVDFVKIAVPALADPALDAYLLAYAQMRADCRAVLRTPIGISGRVGIEYREGEGIYTHVAHDTWYGTMVFGAIDVFDPLYGGERVVSAIGDVLGIMTVKDNAAYAWFTSAGGKRGKLSNTLGVEYNLGSPARKAEFDLVVMKGINPVVEDRDFGTVLWGNRSLQKTNTLLQKDNVADLMIFILRGLSPLIRIELFEPNDLATWKNIYRKVEPFMDLLVAKRGIWKYLYQGDQDIDNLDQLQINSQAGIDAGQYCFHLWFCPKVGLEYIGVKTVITNSGVNFEELAGQPTVV